MKKIIEEYINKVLEFGCNIQNGDSLVVTSMMNIDELKKAVLEVKDKYGINQLIFLDQDRIKLYKFLKSNPKEEEIKQYVQHLPKLKDPHRTKILYAIDDDYSSSYRNIIDNYKKLYGIYDYEDYQTNKEFWSTFNEKCVTLFTWPDEHWAKSLLGSEDDLDKLWMLINQTIPDRSELLDIIKRHKEIRRKLNELAIKNLHFYTQSGTDLSIGLSDKSIWLSEPTTLNECEYFYNFPSYEIYTSPDCNTAEGKVSVIKPSHLDGKKINYANLKFEKGKCVSAESDNEKWNQAVMNENNHLTRIGEIALVSKKTPIAKLNRPLNSLLLDENSGCHLALGNSIDKCIDLPESILNEGKKMDYGFYNSSHHQDLVFGDDSVTVEAETSNSGKKLLLENGRWKI